jgi:hypothetical protein
MDKLGLNLQEYAFLEAVHQWQQNSGTGWAGPGMANDYPNLTMFKQKLATRCGLSVPTMYNFIKKMKARGFFEEKPNKMRVTDDFKCALGIGARKRTVEDEPPTPSVSSENNDGKMFYSDSPYMEKKAFRNAVNTALPLETDLDINFYFDQIKDYYTTENTKAFKNWDFKIATWIKRQIKDGDVRRIGGASGKTATKRTNNELLNDLRKGYKAVRDVNELTTFPDFKLTVTKYIDDAKEAKVRDILPLSVLEDATYYQPILKESGGLLRELETIKGQLKTPLPATNDS